MSVTALGGHAAPAAEPADPPVRRTPGWPATIAAAWQAGRSHALGRTPSALSQQARQIRAQFRPAHLAGADGARVLGFVAAAAQAVLGWRAHDAQGLAAWWMLQGRLVEMATGEGKTLAMALATATAALSGVSVHVMTANDYLVQRDRDLMRPLFDLLGLDSATVLAGSTPAERRIAYRQPIVYATAREVVFDHLKDHLGSRAERDPRVLRAREIGSAASGADAASGGARPRSPAAQPPVDTGPLLPHLQHAFIDEADSILLDEAAIPFILSMPGPRPDRAILDEARALAAQLAPDQVRLDPRRRLASLTPQAQAWLRSRIRPDSPLWPPRQAAELVRAALVAQRLLHRDHDYAVVDGQVLLVDEITGRIAHGRQWSHPLQAMVELEAGCEPSAPLHTAARITYQRFFPRYERLGGMSGSLREAAGELRSLYHCPVSLVPRVRPSQARWLGRRLFRDASARLVACVERIQDVVAAGRPVLIGTASVEASRVLADALAAAGLQAQVLNAVQDAEEAHQIARAGEAGCITVTTNMAGRGTDIRLSPQAHAAGGLHVVLALCNRSRRIDRQLAGRAARQGDPGSAEALLSLDDAALVEAWPPALRRAWAAMADATGELPSASVPLLTRWAQGRCEWRARAQRRDLQKLDELLGEQLAYAGRPE